MLRMSEKCYNQTFERSGAHFVRLLCAVPRADAGCCYRRDRVPAEKHWLETVPAEFAYSP